MTFEELGNKVIYDNMTIKNYFEKNQTHRYMPMKENLYGFYSYLLRQKKSLNENINDSILLYEIKENKLKIENLILDNSKKIIEWTEEKKLYKKYIFFGSVYEFSNNENDVKRDFELFNGPDRMKIIYMCGFYINNITIKEGYKPFCIVYHGNNIKDGEVRIPHFHCLCFREEKENE